MSKIRFGRMLDIANCDEAQLVKAVNRLAEMLGGRVTQYIKDYYGHSQPVSIALIVQDVPRGIGFAVKDGRVVPVGDDWGCRQAYENVQVLLRQTYNTLSMEQKLQQRGYQIQTSIKVVGGVTGKIQANIQGVTW